MAASAEKINVDHTQVQPVMISMWFMQSMFWVILTVVTFFSLTLWYGAAQWTHVAHTLLQAVLGVLLTIPMHWIYRANWRRPARVIFAIIAVVVPLFAVVWSVMRLGSFIWLTNEGSEVWADFGGWYFSGFFIFLCWTAIYYSLQYYRLASEERDRRVKLVERSRAEKVKRLNAEKIAAESRIKMLRYQLNPHFLFNTLNAVNSLIVTEQPEQARNTVERLSAFLRYALKDDKRGWVDLAGEIEALELYLSIERIRFADRLKVVYDIDESVSKCSVPSLLLQPLVENSIKYSINAQEEGGTIWISARRAGTHLELSVRDDGPGIAQLADGEHRVGEFSFEGVGMQNIVDRLGSIYGDQASVVLRNHCGKGLEVSIQIPLDGAAAQVSAQQDVDPNDEYDDEQQA